MFAAADVRQLTVVHVCTAVRTLDVPCDALVTHTHTHTHAHTERERERGREKERYTYRQRKYQNGSERACGEHTPHSTCGHREGSPLRQAGGSGR